MKIENAIMYSLPINKIDSVYLIGKDYDFYRVYISERKKVAVKINLDGKLNINFWEVENNKIPNGILTKNVSIEEALQMLSKSQKHSTIPNVKILSIVISLLKMGDFRPLRKKIKEKLPFYFWIKQQVDREDLIGDLAQDIIRDNNLSYWVSYNRLKSHVDFYKDGYWEITSFKDSNKKGFVDPSLCLVLAKLEFDLEVKKRKLKKFKIKHTEGFVYFLKPTKDVNPIKIGRARNIKNRIKQIQTSLPYDLECIGYIETMDYFALELKIHRDHKKFQIKREWYDISILEVIKIIEKYNGEIILNNN